MRQPTTPGPEIQNICKQPEHTTDEEREPGGGVEFNEFQAPDLYM